MVLNWFHVIVRSGHPVVTVLELSLFIRSASVRVCTLTKFWILFENVYTVFGKIVFVKLKILQDRFIY